MIEMLLAKVILQDNAEQSLIYLREKEGERTFPIVIGPFEAQEIWRQVEGEKTPRPLTHQLLATVMERLGGYLKRVLINDLENKTFFARLVIQREDEELEVDARPSDAIALATRYRCSILVSEEVLESVSKGA
ncbi:MAG: bifunctional nuclease family protein [Planctomycetes bacterium]|nr:bifunctional nuclease family protein [Planctomycetota bacterium]